MSKIIDVFSDEEEGEKVAVIDQSGELFTPFEEQLKMINKDIQLQLYDGSENEGEKAVKNDKYKGLLVLSLNNEGLPVASYKARSIADSTLPATLQQGLQQALF